MKIIDKYFYNITLIISISIILKLFLIDLYGDTTLQYEWKTLFENLKNHKTLSYRSFDDELIPSVYMPPLYVYYLYCVDFITPKNFNLVKSILISQIIISSISIYIFYKINRFFFLKKSSLIATYVFIFFPIHIYSNLQISSITLQIFLNIIFLYLILNILENRSGAFKIFILGIVSGLTMLLRGEFIIIYFFSIFYLFFFKKLNFKKLLLILIITLVSITPYLTRNFLVFEKITITKSVGYNLWKGNNIDSGVEGSESAAAFSFNNINKKINEIPKNKYYDFNYDRLFFEEGLLFIKNDPILFIKRYINKSIAFLFFNLKSKYNDYYNLLNILPLVILSLLFVSSILLCFQKKSISYKYLILNILLTISIFSFFFILPRYKLIILPIQIIVVNFLINKYFKFDNNKGV